jgi:ubiquinone/menaquinone biosynthesis C-methylase UbiE
MKLKFISLFFLKQKQIFINEANNHEDKSVIKFLNGLEKNKKCRYLEVGSGFGRFPLKIKKLFKNIEIECFEINRDLAKITLDNGLHTTVGDAVFLPYSNENFDVLHCSHVIEHFKYPEITNLLDQLVRVVKTSGYIIIRSPLLHPDFYLDIDHIRPYPPETILNYFNNQQQQIVGRGKVKLINCWYRRQNYKIFNIGTSKIKYFINAFLAFLWTFIKFPFSKKNGYIIILQKI